MYNGINGISQKWVLSMLEHKAYIRIHASNSLNMLGPKNIIILY